MRHLLTTLASGALLLARPSFAGYTGAICIAPGNPSAAVYAQCPADHPNSCSAISQSNYCCPANTYCTWANAAIACCPNGETCSGWAPQPTTTYYYAPATTVVTAPVVVVPPTTTPYYYTTAYVTPYTTPHPVYAGYYCSTLYETGPNLPTTAAGDCGTILITTPSDAARGDARLWRMGLMLAGMHALGGLVLSWR